ncbi:MAG: glutamate synthase central domain-containing protein, partial [Nitrospinota bacterium]|nr:glutamate synthase central domain-containing protein [Nitrospinota bacterium]
MAYSGHASGLGLYDPAFEHDACGVAFVADLHGRKSRKIVEDALTALKNLAHRGASGSEVNTGDGAGILLQMPHEFLNKVCGDEEIILPGPGLYGAGMVFLPPDFAQTNEIEILFESIIREEGCQPLGWREVPVDLSSVGPTALSKVPRFQQIFIGGFEEGAEKMQVERKLYVIRKRIEHAVRKSDLSERIYFHIPSLSSQTLIYNGMLTTDQVELVFADLSDPDMESALALVHSRFSTNTFPSWPLAHPYRYMCHNGEINTLRGNINWMHAREALCETEVLPDLKKILPIVIEGGSDSAIFDNVLEFLFMGGRELPHAVLMMIPEPWAGHESMSEDRKAFYEFHGCLMEPWDGPASIAFTDGTVVGAVLDRNGLRPSRYYVTKDDLVIMASEVGVLDIPPEDVLIKERLHPGRIFLVDTSEGRIIDDEELKRRYTMANPYQDWLEKNLVHLDDLPDAPHFPEPDHETVLQRQQAFGYTLEDKRFFIGPMVKLKNDPTGSMGNDAALAVLSDRPRLLYDYFKQLFAQVTNPPIDSIRERIVMSLNVYMGAKRSWLEESEAHAKQILLQSPFLFEYELEALKNIGDPAFQSELITCHFKKAKGPVGLDEALASICEQAASAVREGKSILVLTDREADGDNVPIPMLL